MRCSDCGLEKDPVLFPRNRSTPTGRGAYCKECHNRRGREFVRRKYGSGRHYHLRQRYGISADEVEALKMAQGALCPICQNRMAEHVDHDHATGRVRAILCEPCNGFLGAFNDDPALLKAAIEYLEKAR